MYGLLVPWVNRVVLVVCWPKSDWVVMLYDGMILVENEIYMLNTSGYVLRSIERSGLVEG